MKGIYLGAFRAYHQGYNIDYQDINGLRDIPGDMVSVDLSNYDFIICTPPCNFWSRNNPEDKKSDYAKATAYLLPYMINKLVKLGKPFIVENVRNLPRMRKYGVFNYPVFVYFVGRHTYFSNIMLCLEGIEQPIERPDLLTKNKRQGGYAVHQIINIFLETIYEE